MTAPSRKDWTQWWREYPRLPFARVFSDASLPASWLNWWEDAPFSALLETGKSGRYTILVPKIEQILVCGDSETRLLTIGSAKPALDASYPGPPLQVLRGWRQRNRSPRLPGFPPFLGGLVGFFSYDLVRLIEKLPAIADRDLDVPVAAFAIADNVYVFDHQENTLCCALHQPALPHATTAEIEAAYAEAEAEIDRMHARWRANAGTPPPAAAAPTRPVFTDPAVARPARFSFSRDEFMSAVRRIQNFIRSGDTYQTNLSIRETRPLHARPEAVYEELRRINPSPYMALLRLPGFSLVSGSPELLVRLREGKLEARPIAGTRPRGDDADQDEALNRDLIVNEKERAEHLMLVDLIRNDLGRVSEFGTVRVSEFMTVERYSHVMHIVSHIEGRLAPGKDGFDVIAATFPGGTITGAPKVRTMEIIEELEPSRRGPYTGSIGWLGFNGDLELNITIRTLLAMNGEAHVQAGAGIVIDSDPEREYEESIHKGRALWAAVEAAERRMLAPSTSS